MNMNKIFNMTVCALFTSLIAVGAFIKIPVPYLPFTLQTLFVGLAGIVLGAKLAAISAAIYVIIGLIGVPVFTTGGGIGSILQPSFGFLIGFIAAGYVTGKLSYRKTSLKSLMAANLAGIAVTYFFGLVYYYLISRFYLSNSIGIISLLLYCFIPFIPGDIVKAIVASYLGKKLKAIKKI